ncbi:CU044_5270 family protein [Pseudofrankia asymbiotica]|uniref:Uncharacterized protein n=1 Tax=Pseudofrankia asymbiotica TaxID=1834516 RepID=A0A1V2IDS1_9ACTN|nr:CU044_5270 family protein [Pseudofrankia asymbiotica]ONH31267.1 hypothetical protein BL253_10440 [Pseudofrankia asymbiotica]
MDDRPPAYDAPNGRVPDEQAGMALAGVGAEATPAVVATEAAVATLAAEEMAVRAELVPVGLLRADVARPGPAELAAARQRLLDRMAAEDCAVVVPGPRKVRAARAAQAARGPAGERRRWRPRVTARRVIAVTVVAVVAAAGLFTVETLNVGGSAGATAEAATLLESAAVGTVTSDPPVGPTQYRKSTTRAAYLASTSLADGKELSWLTESVTETWIPSDPARPWVVRQNSSTPVRWFNPADEAFARGAGLIPSPGPPSVFQAVDGEFAGPITDIQAWQAPTAGFLARLPRDPERLLERIYHDSKGQGNSKDGEALVFIADVLRTGFASADLRAAMYRAAIRIPGVTVTDHAANLAGRMGVAVGRDEGDDTRQEMIFDPVTGEFIGEREVILRDGRMSGVPAGTATDYTAVTTEVVDSAPTSP